MLFEQGICPATAADGALSREADAEGGRGK